MSEENNTEEVLLTDKQEAFCHAYIESGIASTAYREAYNSNTERKETVYTEASKLLKKPKIAQRIRQLRADFYTRNKATLDEALSNASDILRADIADAFNEDGTMKKPHEMPRRLRMAIEGIDTDEIFSEGAKIGETKKLKLSSRMKAIDLFMKHFGGYEKHNEQKETSNVVIFELPDNGRG